METRTTFAPVIVLAALLACKSETSAPEPNPEIASAQASAQSGRGKAQGPSREELKRLPVIDGFEEFKFGESYKKVRTGAKLRKRCKGGTHPGTWDKKFPGQSFAPRYVWCEATIADRYATLWLEFDHEDALYKADFRFDDTLLSGKVKELTGEEAGKFVADLRGVLEPKFGKAIDTSSDGILGKELVLRWPGRSSDDPPHQTEINVNMSTDTLLGYQLVEWVDKTRESAMKTQIEKERTDSIKKKGL